MHASRFAELELRARALLTHFPQSGLLWQLFGLALSKQGKDALQPLTEAVKYLPGDAIAHLNLGNAFGRSGRLEEAAASFQRALSIQPDLAEAHSNLGDVQLELGKLAQAATCLRLAIQLRPELAEAHQKLGKTLLRAGHYEEALESCERAVRLAPESAEAHNSLGNALSRLGRFERAIASLQHSLALSPSFAEAHANLANAQRSMGRLDEAVNGYRLALRIKPDFIPAYTELATTLRLQRLTAEAEAVCREALRLARESAAPDTPARDPTPAHDSAAVLAVLAELRADAGRFSEAEDYFKSAIAVDPACAEAWAGLARVRRMTPEDGAWLNAAQSLVQQGLPPQREMTLRYAIGKYFDDVKDFPAAFGNYQRANELAKRSAPPHDRGQVQRSIDLIIRAHDRAWLAQHRTSGRTLPQDRMAESQRPVFIIGMLRSGTSLAEQILASHPAVFGAGELTYWSTALASLLAGARFDNAKLASLRAGYLDQLQRMSGDVTRVVDKLPTNFLVLGLINAALPGARIIHMQRNPIDTCLSIYRQQFEAINTYTHDLGDLADYYRQYQRLMSHWRSVLPRDTLLEVPYEELVADTPGWTRTMLEFVDLPWHPRCLEFDRTPRTVITASKWQVRQGIDSSSVERWRHYEQFLGPLLTLVPASS
jgi:tetratricopeptide (TPR) repeat protein